MQASGFLRVLYAALSVERPQALAVAFDGRPPSPGAGAREDVGGDAEQYAADVGNLRALLAGLRVQQRSDEGEAGGLLEGLDRGVGAVATMRGIGLLSLLS